MQHFSVSQVATILGKHPDTVYTYIEEGRLHASRNGGRYRVTPADLTSFIQVEKDCGRDPFSLSKKKRERLVAQEVEFTIYLAAIEEDPEESDQKRLLQIAWDILSTSFVSEQRETFRAARRRVLQAIEEVRGNTKFNFLILLRELYYSLLDDMVTYQLKSA